MFRAFLLVVCVGACFILSAWPADAKATLASPFGEGMVLQRNQKIPVWGKARPGERVTLRLKKQIVHAYADKKGLFRVDFAAEPAGGPFTLTIESSRVERIKNVYIGEVWLCAGQSNMVMMVDEAWQVKKFLANRSSQLHLLRVPAHTSPSPIRDFSARWQFASEDVARKFSAIAYGFGNKLANDLNLPVGIICCAVGGTSIDAWTPGIESEPDRPSKNKLSQLPVAANQQNIENTKNSRCFNGQLNPLIPYGIRGMVWYQGETDLGQAKVYAQKFPNLIQKLRDLWSEPEHDFPFIFVQLPRNNTMSQYLGDFVWADFRLAQESATHLKNVYMVSAIDIGETDTIHPKNKFTLSQRLALTALARCYSKQYVCSGPSVKDLQIVEGDKVRITFDCGVDSLRIRGDGGFSLSSSGGSFVPAKVERRSDALIVSANEVKTPVRLQYAYANVPSGLILNKDGFPLPPFNHTF